MNRKNFIYFIFAFIISLSFSSCSLFEENNYSFLDTDREFSDKTFAKLIEAINQKDTIELSNLFSINTRNNTENFEDSVNQLVNFFGSQILTFEKTDGVGSMGKFEDGKKVIELITTYNVNSNEQKYYFSIEMTKFNTFNENYNGILCLNIINAKDWQEDYVYYGDSESGIHIFSDN